MKTFVVYNTTTGEIMNTSACSDDGQLTINTEGYALLENNGTRRILPQVHYVDTGTLEILLAEGAEEPPAWNMP